MTKNSYEDDPEKIEGLNKKLKKDILQAIRDAGLNITEEHFDAIMRIWGIREIEKMLGIEAGDPRNKPEAKNFVTVTLRKYQERERKLNKILAK